MRNGTPLRRTVRSDDLPAQEHICGKIHASRRVRWNRARNLTPMDRLAGGVQTGICRRRTDKPQNKMWFAEIRVPGFSVVIASPFPPGKPFLRNFFEETRHRTVRRVMFAPKSYGV